MEDGSYTTQGKEKIELFTSFFAQNDMTLTIPHRERDGTPINEHYHMIEGQKLLHLCWEIHFPNVKLCCTQKNCKGTLERFRSNWSDKKKLFPIFHLSGPPTWAMVMEYRCKDCSATCPANDPTLVHSLPIWVRKSYLVDTKYMRPKATWHLHRELTTHFQTLLPTYGSGDLVARLIYEGINESYVEKNGEYYSYHKFVREVEERLAQPEEEGWFAPVRQEEDQFVCPKYPENPKHWLPTRSPTGNEIRDLFRYSATSVHPWSGITEKMRATREIQSVQTSLASAQDTTFDAAKNYPATSGIKGFWDMIVETGEIASCVGVGTNKADDYAHAAEALAR
jgi:hypothetical protein